MYIRNLLYRTIPSLLITAAGVFTALTDIIKTINKIIKKYGKSIPKYNFKCLYISGLPFESGECQVKIYKDTADFITEGKSATLCLNKITNATIENNILSITYLKNSEKVIISIKFDDNYNKTNEIINYLTQKIKINI